MNEDLLDGHMTEAMLLIKIARLMAATAEATKQLNAVRFAMRAAKVDPQNEKTDTPEAGNT
jgi:hypothetical protein